MAMSDSALPPCTNMSDVEVVLTNAYSERTPDAIQQLESAGAKVLKERIEEDKGCLEATVPTSLLHHLRQLECVSYVREIFRYECEPPIASTDEEYQPL